MNARADFQLTPEYFRASFDNWLSSKSKYRRWQLAVSVLLCVAGIAVLLGGGRGSVLGGAMIGGGLFHAAEFYWYRWSWVRQRVNARDGIESHMQLAFDDDGIYIKGPTSEGRVSWRGIKGATEGKGGVLLSFGDGMSMYVPRQSLVPPDAMSYIVRRVAEAI